ITTASEEIKEPAKNIPRAILLTLLIATAIYVSAALVIVGASPYTEVANLDSPVPIAHIYGTMLGTGAFYLGLAGMAASNYAALNATFLSTARVTYALGRDRYLPGFLEHVNPRFKTPLPALLVSLIAVSVFALTGRVDLVAALSGLAYLVGQAIVNSSVIRLREHGLNVPGTFKSPFYPAFPLIGVGVCLFFIVNQSFESLRLGFLLAVIGLVIYLGYGRSRNRAHLEKMRPERTAATVRVVQLKMTMDNTVGRFSPITEEEIPMVVKNKVATQEDEKDRSTADDTKGV
ncbi:MAG: APC family permease, partial [Candidatus Thorarchaeota archaeon]